MHTATGKPQLKARHRLKLGIAATISRLLRKGFGLEHIARLQTEQRNIIAYTAWLALLQRERYRDDRMLAPHGFKVYSQADEDGFIHEIFLRIGTEHRTFVEIGVSHGLECNTRLLLRYGWRGCWIDGDLNYSLEIQNFFSKELNRGQLQFACEYVTRENINRLLSENVGATGLDLLSIDIDGNDYHVLDALEAFAPRVIVLEYNPIFAPPIEWVVDYDPTRAWRGGDWYGASLKSYELMLSSKGYSLVGCTLNGNNAFFVRRELLGTHFVPDASAEFHFEPQRFWLTHAFVGGHTGDPAT
jgi:hypothetical protein